MLSVVMLTYNERKYVSQAIESVLNQVTKYKFEIVIADDASSDGTEEIVREFANKYPKIIKAIIRQNNIGLIKNYFDAISMCKGKYIMFCAGDDYWEKNKIEKQLSIMENNCNIGMTHSGYYIIDKYDSIITKVVRLNIEHFFDSLFRWNFITALSVCIRKDLLDDYIFRIDPVQKQWLMEDYPLWLYVIQNSLIEYIAEPLCYYRSYEGSLSNPNDLIKEQNFEKSKYDIRVFYARNIQERQLALKIYRVNYALLYIKHGAVYSYIRYSARQGCLFASCIELIKRIFNKIEFMFN